MSGFGWKYLADEVEVDFPVPVMLFNLEARLHIKNTDFSKVSCWAAVYDDPGDDRVTIYPFKPNEVSGNEIGSSLQDAVFN